EEVALEAGLHLDREEFEATLEATRVKARETWKGSGEVQVSPVYQGVLRRAGASTFVGYELAQITSPVVAIIVDGREVEGALAGQGVDWVFAPAPLYGEAGGQVGDPGRAIAPEHGVEVEITDTQIPAGGLIVHYGEVKRGTVRHEMTMQLDIDAPRR